MDKGDGNKYHTLLLNPACTLIRPSTTKKSATEVDAAIGATLYHYRLRDDKGITITQPRGRTVFNEKNGTYDTECYDMNSRSWSKIDTSNTSAIANCTAYPLKRNGGSEELNRCISIVANRCGDGFITHSEKCDPNDENQTNRGNGGCNVNTCEPIYYPNIDKQVLLPDGTRGEEIEAEVGDTVTRKITLSASEYQVELGDLLDHIPTNFSYLSAEVRDSLGNVIRSDTTPLQLGGSMNISDNPFISRFFFKKYDSNYTVSQYAHTLGWFLQGKLNPGENLTFIINTRLDSAPAASDEENFFSKETKLKNLTCINYAL